MMTLYRVAGTVTAPDGTSYTPTYWGTLATAYAVLDAIYDGAITRRETATLTLDTGPGTPTLHRRRYAAHAWEEVAPV